MSTHNPDQDDFDPALDEAGDDFVYEEETFEDDALSEDESWDESADDSLDQEVQEPARKAKKKGGLFNIVLILAALIGGGGFIYLKVLAPSADTPAAPVMAESSSVAEAPLEQQAQTEPAPVTPDPQIIPAPDLAVSPLTPAPDFPEQAPLPETAAAPDSIAILESPQQPVEVSDTPPMPAPIGAPDAEQPSQGGFVAGLPSARDIMITPTETAPAPVSADLPASTEAVQASAGVSDDLARAIEQKLSVLITRLDTFEGRMASLETGLHQVSSKMSAIESTSVSPSAPSADLTAVNNALQSLEKKMAILENAGAVAPLEIEKGPKEDIVTEAPQVEQPTFVPAEKEIVSEPVKVEGEALGAAPTEGGWILRSAQPGAAMVVPKSGGEMRSVAVGDTLKGLGKITSIEMKDSRWVVQGTQGRLTN